MKDARKSMPGRERLCKECDQPMLPNGVTKLPNEYDHAQGCSMAVTGALKEAIKSEGR